MEKYSVLGLMSGTSLDGLDIAHCEFIHRKGKWTFKIKTAKTFSYKMKWANGLADAHKLNSNELSLLNIEYGHFIGKTVNNFIKKYNPDNNRERIDFISSHGHTVFHQPEKKFTLQIGDGCTIAAET